MGFQGIESASSKGPPPTEAQLDFLYDLCAKYGTSQDTSRVDQLRTMSEASEMINRLKGYAEPDDYDDSLWDLDAPF
jgi:hypothetical protein